MKKLILLSLLALTGCTGPAGSLDHVFPAGSSFSVGEATLNVSMTGSGSIVLKEIRCIGTNGFPLPDGFTNSTSTSSTTMRSTR